MAFVSNMQDDEQKQDPNAPQQGAVSPVGSGGGAVRLSPSSAVPTAGGGSGTPGTGAAPNTAGGSFASLDKYLTANQGQAAPLAGKITGQIGQQYNQLDQANQGVLQNINGQVTNAPGYTKSDNALIAQESAAPVSFANDAGNVSSFQKQLTDTYGGPTNAEGDTGYQSQQAAVNNAIATGQTNTNTEAGRQSLIAQNSATPTTGVTALNSAILSQDPNSLSAIEGAYKPFQNLVTGLTSGAQGIDQTIASEQADAASAAQNSLGAVTGQITGLNSNINNTLATDQQNATAQNAAVNAALKSGTADPSVLSALGINQNQWDSLTAAQKAAATSQVVMSANQQFGANSGTQNIDLGTFNTQLDPNVVFNTANVATPEQYQEAQAYQTLLGNLNLPAPAAIINQSTAAQGGTAPTSTNTYNYGGALSTTQTAQQAETAAAQAYVAALQAGSDEAHAQQKATEASNQVMLSQKIGTGVGTAAGAAIGSLFAGVGAVPGAAIGGALGTAAGNTGGHVLQNYAKDVQGPSSTNRVADIATGGLATPITSTIQTVKDLFCFHPDTQVEMANGSVKAICKIRIGDETKGGMVIATTRGLGQGFYWYDGVLVTAKHAVKEDGKWVRIENSKRGRLFPYLTEVVCNLVTEKHRIWANGVEFADEHENDNYENLNLQEALDALNNNE